MADKRTILVTGASGFVGGRLTRALLQRGYAVVAAGAHAPALKHGRLTFEKLDVVYDAIPERYDGELYGIVHLAGKNILGRWTKAFKDGVYASRIASTKKIVDTVARWKSKPRVLVSASAFGFYGDAGDVEVDESAGPGADFLAGVCADWEAEATRAQIYGVRAVQVRMPHVLGDGGLLAPLFLPFKFGLGAWIGEGDTWMPWAHIDDVVAIYIHALETEGLSGPLNAATQDHVRQKELMQRFAHALGRRALLRIPVSVLRLRYGALALTFDNSVKLSPKKLLDSGFVFKYPSLDAALTAVLSEMRV